jgi:Spy/CpxP family protein refolding chaperone
MNKTMFRRIAMRAGAVALCSAALCTVPMMAQGGGAGGPGGGGGGGGRGMGMPPQAQVDALDKAVTLTADQKTKVLAIYTAEAKARTDMMATQPPDPDARTKFMAMRTKDRADIRALLTPDQQTKFDAMPQGGRGGGGGAPGGGAPPTPPPGQ